jgi:hypothetical protein
LTNDLLYIFEDCGIEIEGGTASSGQEESLGIAVEFAIHLSNQLYLPTALF